MNEVLGSASHVRGLFLGINENSSIAEVLDLHTDSKLQLQYDFLVIASGMNYPSPIRANSASWRFADRRREMRDYFSTLSQANTVLVSGGGLVGVEMAAELVHRFSDKSVILVNRSPLLATLPKLAGKLAEHWLKQRGVRVVFDEIVRHESSKDKAEAKVAVTKRGLEFGYDLAIDCTGLPTSHRDTAPPYDSHGNVQVNQFLQVPFSSPSLRVTLTSLVTQAVNHTNIFSCGDAIVHSEGVRIASDSPRAPLFGARQRRPLIRNAHLAESQAEVVAHNIRCMMHPTSPRKLLPYPEGAFGSGYVPILSCVSLGE